MKRIIILAVFILMGATIGFAQEIQERVESMRVAFITNKLQLTPEESQQFWPIFNAYREELQALREQYNMPGTLETMSDSEAEQFLDDMIQREQEEVELKRELINDLREVISVRQILLLKKAENDFKRKLLGLRQQNNGRRGPPNQRSK